MARGFHHTFHAVDYIIFVVIFAISVFIGLYHGYIGRRQRTPGAYLMGNRRMSLLPVTLSMVVSIMSTNTMLGVPAETYNYGIQIVLKAAGTAFGALLAGIVFVPLIYPLKLTSTYEYLELRFGSKYVRRMGSLYLAIVQCLYVGCVIIGASVSLQTAVGLPSWVSIIIITVFGTVATAAGGLKGVIWTDVFQSVIMLIGLVLVLVMGIVKIGGLGETLSIGKDWGRIYISTKTDPTERMNLLSGLVGFTFTWFALYGVNQPQVQRFSSLVSQPKAIAAVLLNPVGFTVFHVLSVLIGLVVFAYYINIGCDPLKSGIITNSNQLLIYFVMDVFAYPGLPGAFVSCLFCGALSSQSSSLNAVAAVLWEDFLKERYLHWSESRKSNFIKVSVLVLGAISGGLAILLLYIGVNLQQLAISFYSMSLGPLLGIFLLGALVPFANAKGAFVGGLLSLLFNVWLLVGQTVYKTQRTKLPSLTSNCTEGTSIYNMTAMSWQGTPVPDGGQASWGEGLTQTTQHLPLSDETPLTGLRWLYSVSFVWYGLIGCILTLIIGSVVSLATGCEKRKVPLYLLSPLIRPFLGKDDLTEKDSKPLDELQPMMGKDTCNDSLQKPHDRESQDDKDPTLI